MSWFPGRFLAMYFVKDSEGYLLNARLRLAEISILSVRSTQHLDLLSDSWYIDIDCALHLEILVSARHLAKRG